MTTHRRAWMVRAGVVVALTAGALVALPPASALAAPPPDVEVDPGSVTIQAGGDATVTVRITTRADGEDKVNVSLTGLPSGVSCASGCGEVTVTANTQKNQLLTLKAAATAPAANGAPVTVRVETASNAGTKQFSLTVVPAPPPQKPTVKEISGKVTDSTTGEPISGALVMISDSQNHRQDVVTTEAGAFRFTGSSDKPITPGQIQIGARKDDATVTRTISATAGGSVTNYRLVLKLAAAAPTDSPSPEAVSEAPATESIPSSEPAAAAADSRSASDKGSGIFGSWLLILVGGLLVALGVGAIVLLLVRRKDSEPEDEPIRRPAGGAYNPAGGPPPVATPFGAASDPTMMAHAPLPDAPTMMHVRPPVDEFPDPYGAPLPQPPFGAAQQPGWAGNDYNGAPADGFGGGYGTAPGSGNGYGGGRSSGAGYPGPGGGAGYDASSASAAGYGNAPGSGGGYGNAPGSGAGYGNAPGSGGGYGQAGHTGAAGAAGYPGRDHGAPTSAQGGGYPGQPAGGYGDRYDEPTGRYETGSSGYGQAAPPYDEGSYRPGPAHDRGYGPDEGHGPGRRPEYGRDGYDPAGGYGEGYGSAPGGEYDPRGDERYVPQGGYEQGGYGRVPEQRGRGYEPDDYYAEQGPADHGRRGTTQQPDRSPRRSVDWLDD